MDVKGPLYDDKGEKMVFEMFKNRMERMKSVHDLPEETKKMFETRSRNMMRQKIAFRLRSNKRRRKHILQLIKKRRSLKKYQGNFIANMEHESKAN